MKYPVYKDTATSAINALRLPHYEKVPVKLTDGAHPYTEKDENRLVYRKGIWNYEVIFRTFQDTDLIFVRSFEGSLENEVYHFYKADQAREMWVRLRRAGYTKE